MKEDKNILSEKNENTVKDENVSEDYRPKAGRLENIAAKVCCVLAAVVLWFYVVGTSTAIEEMVFEDVPVILQGAEEIEAEFGLSVISGYDYDVDVTLEGARADLRGASTDNLTAFVDISGIKSSGEYSLEVDIKAPSGVKVVGQSVRIIRVYVDKSVSQSVPVEVEPLYSIEATYSIGTPEPNFETVNVTGPEDELNNISHARVVLELGRISKTLTATGKLELIGKDGSVINNPYVKLQTSEVTVLIPVYGYKDVPLKVSYKHGYFSDSTVAVTLSPSSVKIKGDPGELNKIDSIVIPINEKEITGDSVITMAIPMPEVVENVSGSPSVSIKITHKNTETREMMVTSFKVLNPNNIPFTHSSGVSVTFRGSKTALALLNANNVRGIVDLGAFSGTPGTYEVPVTIEIDEPLSDSVYEIGKYRVEVTVK